MIAILPNGMPPMGKLLAQQVLFFIIGSVFIAYLASLSLIAGADAKAIFRYVFTAAFVTYAWAQVPYSIWMGQPWSNCLRFMLDAAIYAAVTAATFVFFWPSVL